MKLSSEHGASGDDPRTQFAAERTLLAWIRTGLAMMGFGFVVARFGLFLREIAAAQGDHASQYPLEHRLSVSLWVGTALVLLGVAVNVCAAAKHYRTVQRLSRGEPLRFQPLSIGIVVAALLALMGTLVALYLIVGLYESR
ncbi:MAG TPA: DUF202 domain-containing protein [Pirellulales bacterium]|jgi:putative membrane protein